ncbi:hypothetical protein PUN28_008822 [Cardiocondyla obscurior]|uniref:Uncharacterized protein n=1 Tax=Cardiocondyla obscurior TaxID=286306 RepID=A0AAW2FSF8_9HYME
MPLSHYRKSSTSDAHEASHPLLHSTSPHSLHPFSPLLPPPPSLSRPPPARFPIVSHPVARARETDLEKLLRPTRRSSLPRDGPHRSSTLSTCRDASARG